MVSNRGVFDRAERVDGSDLEWRYIDGRKGNLQRELRFIDAELIKYNKELNKILGTNFIYESIVTKDNRLKIFEEFPTQIDTAFLKLKEADLLLEHKERELETIKKRVANFKSGEEVIRIGAPEEWARIDALIVEYTSRFAAIDAQTKDLHQKWYEITGQLQPFLSFVVDGKLPVLTPSFNMGNIHGVRYLEASYIQNKLQKAKDYMRQAEAKNERLFQLVYDFETHRQSHSIEAEQFIQKLFEQEQQEFQDKFNRWHEEGAGISGDKAAVIVADAGIALAAEVSATVAEVQHLGGGTRKMVLQQYGECKTSSPDKGTHGRAARRGR